MPYFKVTVSNKNGGTSEETIFSLDEKNLLEILKDKGLFLIHSAEVENPKADRKIQKVKKKDLIDFFAFLEVLINAGISITDSLALYGDNNDDEEKSNMKKISLELIKDIKGGEPISKAMDRHTVFDSQIINLVAAGEESGQLKEVFEAIKENLLWTEGIKKQVFQALIYPTAVIIAVIGFITLIFGFTIPKIQPILEMTGQELPEITVVVLSVSAFLTNYWYIPTSLIIFTSLLPKIVKMKESWELKFDTAIMSVPQVGPIIRMASQAKFITNFKLMNESGIDIIKSLKLCAMLTGNEKIKKSILNAREDIIDGENISASFEKEGVFDEIVIKMMQAAEETGDIKGAMGHIANYFDREIKYRIKRLLEAMVPAITIVLGVIVGSVALAIFLPMLNMIPSI